MIWVEIILAVVFLASCGVMWYLLGEAKKATGEMKRILTEFSELVKKSGGDPW